MRHLDLENDRLVPVAAIFKDRTGKRLNPPTLWRWVRGKGCHGIKLEAVPVNGVWCSTPKAYGAFLEEQAAARLAGSYSADESPSPVRDEKTTRKLQAAGLLKTPKVRAAAK
jgi:hypothetical protein